MIPMKKNKKAWLRIVEATIAVLIVASVIFIMIVRAPREGESNVREMQRFVLEQVSKNDTLRAEVLNEDVGDSSETVEYINSTLPGNWGFQIRVCEVEEVCGMQSFPAEAARKEIYGDEIFISSTLQDYSPKKLKLFVWIN